MSKPLFSGVGVALVTVFDDDARVDEIATAEHAARLVGLGIASVLVAGSTGEASALSVDERVGLVAAVRKAVPTGVPVIAGSGAPTGRQAADLTARSVDAGADAVLSLSPAGVGDPRPYYEAVAAATDASVLAYHFPKVSAPGVPVALLPDLPVRGVKDSEGDPTRLLEELESYDGEVYVGSAALAVMGGAVGATGAILALANAEPEGCVAAFGGDGDAQRALTAAHLTASRSFPAGIKGLVADRFGLSAAARLGT